MTPNEVWPLFPAIGRARLITMRYANALLLGVASAQKLLSPITPDPNSTWLNAMLIGNGNFQAGYTIKLGKHKLPQNPLASDFAP